MNGMYSPALAIHIYIYERVALALARAWLSFCLAQLLLGSSFSACLAQFLLWSSFSACLNNREL